eukprot:765725-Hanusia_phi.AAC.1
MTRGERGETSQSTSAGGRQTRPRSRGPVSVCRRHSEPGLSKTEDLGQEERQGRGTSRRWSKEPERRRSEELNGVLRRRR